MIYCLFILHTVLSSLPFAVPSFAFLSSIIPTVPSGPPLNVHAEPGGGGNVVVSWTQPAGKISGYIIVYGSKAVNVDNPAVTAYTLEDITLETQYTVEMWAYLELPSSRSQPTTIYLDSENLYKVLYLHTLVLGLFCGGKRWKFCNAQIMEQLLCVHFVIQFSFCLSFSLTCDM